MAVGTIGRVSERSVVYQDRRIVVVQVTRKAVTIQWGEGTPEVVHMTALACRLEVGSIQGKVPRVNHAWRKLGERLGGVAHRTRLCKRAEMNVEVTAPAVVCGCLGLVEVQIGMAAHAHHVLVRTDQRE